MCHQAEYFSHAALRKVSKTVQMQPYFSYSMKELAKDAELFFLEFNAILDFEYYGKNR